MTSANDWVLATEASGYTRRFGADALPISIGGRDGDDIALAHVNGTIQIGLLDGVFFVQADRQTNNVRVQSELLQGSRKLHDGDVIAVDHARLICRQRDGRLTLTIEAKITAGDTAPPDFEGLAQAGRALGRDVEIKPVSFRAEAIDAGPREFRVRWGTAALAATFAVLAVLGWFAFTAKSVEFVIEPAPDEIGLPDTWFKLRLGDRFLLRSGRHRVTAEIDGYYPLDATVEVGLSADQSISLTPIKLPGLVTLLTEPEIGAELSLDGERLGTTPLIDAEIDPGVYQLEFSAERYLPELKELVVEGGHEKQRVIGSLTPNWAPVRIETEPPGAEVRVDGELIGSTPASLELTAGERQLEVRLGGFNAWTRRVNVVADQPQELPKIVLTRADGRVALASTPSEAAVNVDGEFRGRTPLSLRLSPGRSHEIVLSKPGYAAVTRELSVEADSGRRLQLELEPLYGAVRIDSDPPNAEIWVDGRRAGVAPAELNLTAVRHRVEVKLDGYAPVGDEITPRPGFPQRLPFKLEALDRGTGSGYPSVIRTSLGQELKLIPAGEFAMGSSRREQGRRSNEVLHDVELSRAFYLGAREVSNAEYRAYRPDHDSGEFAGLSLNGDDQPVVRVTWNEAAQYMNWLSVKDGLQPVYQPVGESWVPVRPLRNGYRLPTEAEWAWAARAAGREQAAIFPWGQSLPPPDRSGNYADLSAAQILQNHLAFYNDSFEVAAPTGSFDPDAFGLFDLGGNVAEWVQDYYAIDVGSSTAVSVDPLGPETGQFHIIRGASWRSATLTELRLAYRNYSPDARPDLGFRIARNLE